MTLQNRVDPWGKIWATPERGTMMGNRGGKFHNPDQTLGNRRQASNHWICCELHWKGHHHEPMGQGYTSLFFLDEVTALAAGHRPCFFCRRQEAVAFLGNERVPAFDKRLQHERSLPAAIQQGPWPDATMVEHDGFAHALRRGKMLRWSFAGYDAAQPLHSTAKILTPPSIIGILRRGYQPRWHESALKWDAT